LARESKIGCQMSRVKDYKVSLCNRKEIADFIEKWHYSKNVNGLQTTYCFKLEDHGNLIGAMMYGKIAMKGVWKKYAENESDIIELRRLCCIDDTPKNTESYFIGVTLRWLRKNTNIKMVISYADSNFGHTGVIYQATNFVRVGMTTGGRVILYDGKRYHDKTIRTRYKGELKPFAKKIREALESGEAEYIQTTGKHIYLLNLRKD
jgi:hypothetical protein